MTDQITAIQPSRYALETVSEKEMARMTNQLISSVTGSFGRPLTKIQAAQLALISLTTDLSPFLGEVYVTDKGIMIGVVAYERKSQEYLDAFLPGTNYHITYRVPTPGTEADYKPDRGDIAYTAILTRDDWDRAWQVKLQDMVAILKEAGLSGEKLFEIAIAQIGPKPYAEAVGVVDGREDFSGTYKQGDRAGEDRPEMFDRHERAKKRARKNVLKHVFPRLNIPDPMKVMSEERAAKLVEVVRNTPLTNRPQIPEGMTSQDYENQLLRDLGQPIETTYRDADFNPTQETAPIDDEVDAVEGELPAFSLDALVTAGLFDSKPAAANIWNRSPFVKTQASDADKWAWFKSYRAARDGGETTEEAIARAGSGDAADWLQVGN